MFAVPDFIRDHMPAAPSAEGGLEFSVTIAKALERQIKEWRTVWLPGGATWT